DPGDLDLDPLDLEGRRDALVAVERGRVPLPPRDLVERQQLLAGLRERERLVLAEDRSRDVLELVLRRHRRERTARARRPRGRPREPPGRPASPEAPRSF